MTLRNSAGQIVDTIFDIILAHVKVKVSRFGPVVRQGVHNQSDFLSTQIGVIQAKLPKTFRLLEVEEISNLRSTGEMFFIKGATYAQIASTLAEFNAVPLRESSCNRQICKVSAGMSASGPLVRAV